MITKIRSAGIPIYFDPASVGGMMQANLAEVKSWIALMDVILLNEEEAMYLTGESNTEKALGQLNQDCPVVVIKRGAAGAIGCARGSSAVSVPALPANVVDTTGAGDSFAAGFIAHYALTSNMKESLEQGAKVAAHCVAIVGARPRVGTSI
jgi:sugar/nucleoside kinase (ribokinase family)